MLKLRPYKPSDAETIISWCRDEKEFRNWTSDRYASFPITADDMNKKYFENNGDCIESDNFYPMTAFDEKGIVGHLIMRYTDKNKKTIRLGFVIADSARRGMGYGKEMILLSVKFAFEIFKAEKVTLGAFENNKPALYCYKAAGFRECESSFCEVFGEKRTIIELELDKDDYYNMDF